MQRIYCHTLKILLGEKVTYFLYFIKNSVGKVIIAVVCVQGNSKIMISDVFVSLCGHDKVILSFTEQCSALYLRLYHFFINSSVCGSPVVAVYR